MELENSISNLFNHINKTLSLTFKLKTHTKRILKPLTKDSTLGEQIKYYRMLEDIKQTDLGINLNFHRSTLHHLENKDIKLVNINLIKRILEELDIENKITINDNYISFLMNDPCNKLLKLRQSLNLTRSEFASLVNVSITTVRRWELGNTHISRNIYNRLLSLQQLNNNKIKKLLVM